MTNPTCRTCGRPVEPGQTRYGPASTADGLSAEHWDCHRDVPDLLNDIREALHLGPSEVHGDPLPRRHDDD